jgi:hypothetical protein
LPAVGGRRGLVSKTVVDLEIWAHMRWAPGCPLAACCRHAGLSWSDVMHLPQRCGDDRWMIQCCSEMRHVGGRFWPLDNTGRVVRGHAGPGLHPEARPPPSCSRVGVSATVPLGLAASRRLRLLDVLAAIGRCHDGPAKNFPVHVSSRTRRALHLTAESDSAEFTRAPRRIASPYHPAHTAGLNTEGYR